MTFHFMITWHNLLAMLAPRSIPHHQGQLLMLDELGEVVSGEDDNSTWGWLPVGIIQLLHVGNDVISLSLTSVVLKLLSILEHGQGWVSLDHVLLGQLDFLGAIHLDQMNAILGKDLCCLLVFYKYTVITIDFLMTNFN